MLKSLLRTSLLRLTTLLAPLALAPELYGQSSISSFNVPVTQTFNALPASGTLTFGQNSTIPGVYGERSGNGSVITANTGSSNAGGLYSYGTGTDTDRALGSVGSSNAAAGNFTYGVRLKNNTGATVTSLQISYAGEQWRNSAAAAQTVDFSYRIADEVTSTVPGSGTATPGGFTAVDELDFVSPVTGGSAGAINGNDAANRAIKTYTLTNLTLNPGQEIMLRWYDPDHAGADHGLSIDDVTVTAIGNVVSPTLAANPAALTGFSTNAGTPSTPQSYTLTGSNLSGSVSVTAPAGVQVSTDNSSYGTTLSVPTTDGSVSQVVWVRLAGTTAETISGSITNVFNGTLTATVTISGVVNDPNVITPIAEARTRPNGTSITSLPGGKIAGRVTASNQFGSTAYIQDGTAGIAVFNATFAGQVQIGDSVQITGGTLSEFNQSKQVSEAVTFTRIGNVGPLAPKVVTIADLPAYESRLVAIEAAVIRPNTPVDAANPVFVLTPDANFRLESNGAATALRVNRFTNIPGNTNPAGPATLTGIAGRFNATYQLLPRFTQDIPGSVPYAPGGGEIDRARTLDVVAWNIEWLGNTGNGPGDEDRQFSNAVQVLNSLQADVVVLEEISSAAAINRLVAALPGYSGNCSPFVSNNPGHEVPADPTTPTTVPDDAQRVCILYKTELATIVSQRPLLEKAAPLPNYPAGVDNFWASGRYPYLWSLDVKVANTTRRVNFIGIHAKANTAPLQGSYDRRKYDVQVLYDSLQAQFPNELLVLAGDFNDDLDRTVANVSATESTYKPFVDDAASFTSLTRTLSDNGFRSFLAQENMIDHIVVSNELTPAYVAGSAGVGTPYTFISDYSNTTSDHIPVVARFDLQALIPPLAVSASATPTSAICPDESAQLIASVTSGSPAYQYTWTGPGTISNPGSATATVSGLPTGTHTFTVTVKDADNQTNTATATVTVAPVADAPNYATIGGQLYAANQTSLTVPQYSGEVAFAASNCAGQLSWTGPKGQTGTGNIVVPTSETGTVVYTGICTLGNCASAPTSVTVTVQAQPLKLVAPLYNCATGQLTIRTTGGNGNPLQYMIPAVTTGWTDAATQVIDAKNRGKDLKINVRQRAANGQGYDGVGIVFNTNVVCGSSARLASAEADVKLSVTVVGNPVTGESVQVEVRGATGQPLRLLLTDVQGKPVSVQEVERAEAVEHRTLPVASQSAGLLLLRVSTPTETRVVKLLKR